jgi:hypothetical protein
MEMVKINLLKPKWSGYYYVESWNLDGKIVFKTWSFYYGKNKWGINNVTRESKPRVRMSETIEFY